MESAPLTAVVVKVRRAGLLAVACTASLATGAALGGVATSWAGQCHVLPYPWIELPLHHVIVDGGEIDSQDQTDWPSTIQVQLPESPDADVVLRLDSGDLVLRRIAP
jgi:hypothetical protein